MALGIRDPDNKDYYDELIAVRVQYRNFITQEAFGRKGEAFSFYSDADAVPVRLPHPEEKYSYRFTRGSNHSTMRLGSVDDEAIKVIHGFIDQVWSGSLALARIYLERGLDLILDMVRTENTLKRWFPRTRWRN